MQSLLSFRATYVPLAPFFVAPVGLIGVISQNRYLCDTNCFDLAWLTVELQVPDSSLPPFLYQSNPFSLSVRFRRNRNTFEI